METQVPTPPNSASSNGRRGFVLRFWADKTPGVEADFGEGCGRGIAFGVNTNPAGAYTFTRHILKQAAEQIVSR